MQHRRELRQATTAKLREKQMVKDLQKLKRAENKEVATNDVTADVFATPTAEKPVHIENEKPAPREDRKARKPAPFKRRRLQRSR